MLVGHYAAAMAAKAVEPRAPFWACVGAAQLLDIGWTIAIMTGLERARIDVTLPGAPMSLDYMPYTHSLPAALIWAVLATIAALALSLPRRAAVIVGLVVFSHWLLDLAVHRPDLALGFGDTKAGFALWNLPITEATFEIGLLGIAAVIWTGHRVSAGGGLASAAGFLTLLIAVQIISQFAPPPPGIALLAGGMLVVYAIVVVVGISIDRRPKFSRRPHLAPLSE